MNKQNNKELHITETTSMVDVGQKEVTRRTAMAECYLHFPPEVYSTLQGNNFLTHKGSIISTATIAGIMAVKNTPQILPLCHPIAVSGTEVKIEPQENMIRIECSVTCDGKTGVEMEALTGASAAALCVYDMCKALSQKLTITDLKLCYKKGGKSDYEA